MFSFLIRSFSRSSCSSDCDVVKYDAKAHTYVVNGSFKNYVNELQCDSGGNVGRGRRVTKVGFG